MTVDKFLSTYIRFDELFQGNKTVNKRLKLKMKNFFHINKKCIVEGAEWDEACKKPELLRELFLFSESDENTCNRDHESGDECELEYEEEYLVNHEF